MSKIYDIVTSDKLTYEQKLSSLAHAAEDTLDVLNLSDRTKYFFAQGAICNLNEGQAPYRPRYIMPDYDKAVKNGVKFLELDPPQDLDELINFLMILYRHVPSITTFPVFLGDLDKLIEPFIDGIPDEVVEKKVKLFFRYLDRTITDSFCHANIGPEETRAGRIILKVEREIQQAVPNLTLKYDPAITPDGFAEYAIGTSLICANPAICNDPLNKVYDRYGISSCYNILPIAGGSYTLTRIVLPKLAALSSSKEQFLNELLPECLKCQADYMSERIKFLVEKSNWFETSFLAKEGLVERDRFVAMYGLVGLAECANYFFEDKSKRYGHDAEVDALAEQIMTIIEDFTKSYECPYCEIADHHLLLHAQVGIDTDYGITSGVRIPVGEEPDSMYDHLRHSGRFHKFFPTGCSDIFPFDSTAEQNPAAVLDIVKGAFSVGQKYIAFYGSDSDLVRITGYLVKRSEIEKWDKGNAVLQNTTFLGAPTYKSAHLDQRKVRSVGGSE